jgi:hypothetical protein
MPDATVNLTLDLLSKLFDSEATPNVGIRLWDGTRRLMRRHVIGVKYPGLGDTSQSINDLSLNVCNLVALFTILGQLIDRQSCVVPIACSIGV